MTDIEEVVEETPVEECKCIHSITRVDTTMRFLSNFATMVYPPRIYGVCIECGKSISFVKEGDIFVEERPVVYDQNPDEGGENDNAELNGI